MRACTKKQIILIIALIVFTLFPLYVSGRDPEKPAVEDYPGSLKLPERHTVWPGPGVFRIGNAVAPVNYWMTAWTVNERGL